MKNDIIHNLSAIYTNCGEEDTYDICKYTGYSALYEHQFLLFLKPEILSLRQGVSVDKVLSLFKEHCEQWNVKVGGIKMFLGSYVKRHSLIENNYETLYKLSTKGLGACSESVRLNIEKMGLENSISHINIMGGHQFLKTFPDITPKNLNALVTSNETLKAGSGAYITKILFEKEIYLLINAFHPFQIELLSKPGEAIVAVECFSNETWPTLREEFIGLVIPKEAPTNSFRRKLYDHKKALNIRTVDISYNGIHISPGTYEAALQLKLFFTDKIKTLIEDQLAPKYPEHYNAFLEKNPHVILDENQPAKTFFELTENLSAKETMSIVQRLYKVYKYD